MLALGFTVYTLNVCVGALAQWTSLRFGWLHHLLFAVVLATSIAALLFAFHPALVITVGALILMPRMRPHTLGHPVVAMTGFAAYLLAWFFPQPCV
jgi:hypothetical protein